MKIRKLLPWVLIGLSSALAAWLLSMVGFVQLIHLKAYDLQFLLRGKTKPGNVLLLTVDEKAMNTFPEMLAFWHPYYAEAIRAAAGAGAKVLGLDVAFAIPVGKWEPGHDEAMVAAVSEVAGVMPVVCGYVPSMMAKQQEWPVPINMVASALGLSAYANLTVDRDDFVRSQELIEPPARKEGDVVPRSLPFRVVEKFLGEDARWEPDGRLTLQGREIPLSDSRAMMINYAGPAGTIPRVSLADFIGAARAGRKDQLARWVKGKAVMIGPDSIDDRHATPFYTLLGGAKWNTPGVEIHANTINTVLDRHFLVPVPGWVHAIALTLVGVGTALLIGMLPPGLSGKILAANWVLVAAFSHWIFRMGRILSISEMLLCSLLCIVAMLGYQFSSAEKKGELFRRAVSIFVSKDVAASLEESRKIGLSGVRQEVTILFTDLRGFTKFCESQDPARVVELLNQYLAATVKIIVSHGGKVNKFIGDGILAIFSDADGGQPGDHASRAVRCAHQIVTRPDPLFKTGSGLHTGPVVLGNIGSEDKMEYTVLGDTVNLAARLESMNKEQHTNLLMSEETQKRLAHDVHTVLLGAVAVRGKVEPVKVYTVKGLEPEPTHVETVTAG
jgi:adenylate cyclase